MFKFLRKTMLWVMLAPLGVFGVGIASNQAVLYANNDTFPVRINLAKAEHLMADAQQLPDGTIMLDEVHCLMTPKTHLNFLADNWDMGSIYSVGDILLYLGEWLMSFSSIVWLTLVVDKLRKL